MEYLVRRGRYASCVHAGGTFLFWIPFHLSLVYIVYVVYEPDEVEDGDAIEIETVATAEYIWNEDNCETLMVDPAGTVYLITKVSTYFLASKIIFIQQTNPLFPTAYVVRGQVMF